MSDTGPPPGAEMSEEEMRRQLAQLRGADSASLLAEALSILLNAAQVKLGRNDARLLLDVVAAASDAAGPHVPPELASQLGQAIAQLRLAQVEAEREAAQLRAEGKLPDVEENDLRGPRRGDEQARSSESRPPNSAPGTSAQEAGSRLWVPGRP